ncbi:MAG: YggT family protein [Pseudoclavibacter sp.]|nr:YggT family protein [Pseudoclavibacter sp.]
MPAIIGQILATVITICIVVMWARLVLDYVALFAPSWRPRGVLLLLCEAVYSVTDPPLKAVRKVVPPLRVGNISLDLAWMIVMFALIILGNLLPALVR